MTFLFSNVLSICRHKLRPDITRMTSRANVVIIEYTAVLLLLLLGQFT